MNPKSITYSSYLLIVLKQKLEGIFHVLHEFTSTMTLNQRFYKYNHLIYWMCNKVCNRVGVKIFMAKSICDIMI